MPRGIGHWAALSLAVIFAVSILSFSPMAQARADEVVGTIDTPGFPWGVDVDQKTGMVYATDFELGGGLFVISGATNRMVDYVATGDLPLGLSVDANTDMIYVADYGDSSVAVVSGSTGTMVADLQNIAYPGPVVVNPDTDMVYAGSLVFPTITVINGAQNVVTGVIRERCGTVNRLAVDPATDTIYATTYGGGSEGCILVINGQTDTVAKEISLGYSTNPDAIAVDTRTNMVYVGDSVRPLIYVVNGGSNELAGNLTLPDQYIVGLAVDPATDTLFVSYSYSNAIDIIDAANSADLGYAQAQGADAGVAVDAATGMVYVADMHGGMLYVISGGTTLGTRSCAANVVAEIISCPGLHRNHDTKIN